MELILKNGSSVKYEKCEATKMQILDAYRDALIFTINPSEVALDQLHAMLNLEANTDHLLLVGDPVPEYMFDAEGQPVLDAEGNHMFELKVPQSIHTYFTIVDSVSKSLQHVDTDEIGQKVFKEKIKVVLGRMTPTEIKLAQLGL